MKGQRPLHAALRPSSLHTMSPPGPRTVCSTTIGMSGKARVAVPCRLLCRGEPLPAVHGGEKRTAKRDKTAPYPPAATRASPSSTRGHMPPRAPTRLPELQLQACFAGAPARPFPGTEWAGPQKAGVSLWAVSSPEVGVRMTRDAHVSVPCRFLLGASPFPGVHAWKQRTAG